MLYLSGTFSNTRTQCTELIYTLRSGVTTVFSGHKETLLSLFLPVLRATGVCQASAGASQRPEERTI